MKTTKTSHTRKSAILAGSIAALLAVQSAQAASQVWDGGSLVNGNWSTIENWVGDPAAPGDTASTTNADVTTFNAAIANTWGNAVGNPLVIDSATQNIGGLSFDLLADNYFIGNTAGNSLLLSSGGTIQILNTLSATNAVETINAPLIIQGAGGTSTFANNSANGAGAGAGTLNIGGGITGAVAGATVLTLSGSNTNANLISGIIGNGSATTFGITKSGLGTWGLSGANTFSGQLTVQDGTLAIASINNVSASGTLGNSALAVILGNTGAQTGTLQYTGGNATSTKAFTMAAGGTGAFDVTTGATTLTLSGLIGGSGAMVKTGSGTLTLSGTGITHTGATTISQGTLRLTSASAAGYTSAISVNSGGTLALNGTNFTGSQNITLNGGTLLTDENFGYVISSKVVNVTDNSILQTNGTGIAGNNYISEYFLDAGLNITSGKTLTFNPSTVNNGIVLRGNTSPGSGSLVVSGVGTTSLVGRANLQFRTDGASNLANADVTLTNATMNVGKGLNDANTAGATVKSLSGNGRVYADTTNNTLTVGQNDGSGTFSGVLANGTAVLSLVKTGSGTQVLSGLKSYTGTTAVNGGTLVLSGPNTTTGIMTINGGTLQAGSATAFGSADYATLLFGSGSTGKVRLFGNSMTVVGLNTNANIGTPILESASALAGTDTLTVNNAAANTFAGVLQDGSTRLLALTKGAAGTLTLSGTNTYTGGTIINGGTLQWNGANNLAGALTVNAGGTFSMTDGTANNLTTTMLTMATGSNLAFDWNAGAVDNLAPSVAVTPVAGATIGIQINPTSPSGGPLALITGIGGSTLNNANYFLANNTNYTAGITATPTAVEIASYTGSVPALINAYWKRNQLVGATDVMALSAGTSSNWASDAAGTSAGGVVPGGSGVNVIFGAIGATSNVTVGADMNLGSITFNDSNAFTIGGSNTITLNSTSATEATTAGDLGAVTAGSAISVTSSANANNTINAGLALGAAQTWNVASGKTLAVNGKVYNRGYLLTIGGAGDATIAGEIIGAGGLTKTGAGILTISGSNTYTGTTTVTAGTLKVGSAGAIPTPVAVTSTLDLNGQSPTIRYLTGAGSVLNSGGSQAVLTLNLLNSGAQTFSGGISGNIRLVVQNAGGKNADMQTLSGVNTYTGGTLIDGLAQIRASDDSVLGAVPGSFDAANITLTNGGSLQNNNNDPVLNANRGITLGTGGGMFFAGWNKTITVKGVITGSGSLTKLDSGPLVLTAPNTYTGPTFIGAGTLQLGNGGTSGSLSPLSQITNLGTLTFNRSDTLTQGTDFASVISGGGAVAKVATGTTILSGANTYTGSTTLSGGGTLVLDYGTSDTSKVSDTGALALGGGALTLKGATGAHVEVAISTSLNAGGTFLTRDGANTAKLRMNAITRAAGGTINFGDATIADTDTNNINSILGGWATLGNDWAVSVNAGAADTAVTALASYTGVLPSGTAGVATDNSTLTGPQNQTTSVLANTLKITGTGTGDTLNLDTFNLTTTWTSATSLGGIIYVGGGDGNYNITGTGRILTSTTTGELIVNTTTGVLTTSAPIVATTATAGILTKTGAGTLAVNVANSYTGATYVNQGVLRLMNATASGSTGGGIVVQNGAALELANSAVVGAEALTITGTGVSNGGALRNITSNTSSYAGAITIGLGGARINADSSSTLTLSGGIVTALNRNATIGGAGTVTVQTAAISGAGNLIKDGAGTLYLNSLNTYTGATAINGGTLSVGNGGSGASIPPGTSGVSLSNGASIAFNHSDSLGLNKAITGSGSFVKAGSGTLTVFATQNYNGSTTVSGGILKLKGGNIVPDIVANNSFEAPTIAVTYVESAAPTSWSLYPAYNSGMARVGGAYFAPTYVPDGLQCAFTFGYGANQNSAGTFGKLGQTVSVPQSGSYSVSFYAVGRTNYSTPFDVKIDGVTLANYIPSTTAWTQYTVATPTLTVGNHTIEFVNTTVGDKSVNFDQVTLSGGAFSNLLPITTPLTVAASSTLDLNGGNQQVASLDGSGQVTNSSTSLDSVFTVGDSNTTTFSGSITQSAPTGTLSLVKVGTGALNLDPAAVLTFNSLTANDGTLNVNSPLGTGGNAVVTVSDTAGGVATKLRFGSVSQTLSSLTIGAGATVIFTSGAASGSLTGDEGGGKAAGFGSPASSFGGGATVPEPGTLGLLLVGALGMLNRRRRA